MNQDDRLQEIKDSGVFVLNDMDNNIIVKDDLMSLQYGIDRVKYDAFVLYADEDMEFASDLVEKMENHGFKVRTKKNMTHMYYNLKPRVFPLCVICLFLDIFCCCVLILSLYNVNGCK